MRRAVLVCASAALFTLGGAAASKAGGLSNADCQKMYSSGKYTQAAGCFGALYQKTRNPSYLNNQALVFRRTAKKLRGKPGQSCHLLKRAIQVYSHYARLARNKNEQIRTRALLPVLRKQLHTGTINVGSNPTGAKVSLKGHKTQRAGVTPHSFRELCPGSYTLELQRKGYLAETRTVALTAKKKLARLAVQLKKKPAAGPVAGKTYQLQVSVAPKGSKILLIWGARKREATAPHAFEKLKKGKYQLVISRPGFQTLREPLSLNADAKRAYTLKPIPSRSCTNPLPGAVVLGGAALLLGGGAATGAVAESEYVEARKGYYTNPKWKEHENMAVAMAVTSGIFFVGGGLAAVVGVVLFATSKKPCTPAKTARLPQTTPSPSRASHRLLGSP